MATDGTHAVSQRIFKDEILTLIPQAGFMVFLDTGEHWGSQLALRTEELARTGLKASFCFMASRVHVMWTRCDQAFVERGITAEARPRASRCSPARTVNS